ncbi:hypothetical protein [Staphylococcus saprophyticus]|jgi:ppGpp synthetase/RelA/SpoT-type nucleotidyltranferase|uniref:hypothetical protein n=1 Tax=Staphylococcus saprophyticus TaxID=29385 RepID=UPI00164311C2|nr:hypothetical protein [Staphylococcus saprophyticus]MBC2919673.1 hypothetical protein [Staphylococcus saprophyticus]MBC2956960.1 hypothetical protein [Staphylococcus saprophyticus]MBC3008918.1 hypothetical protein [Staphylococcus saprophyticus]MBC3021991.1 hypothetical protein [Staphylococcus saprophyticus]MBC3029944.1 hypothetical protein [Staphylococcus saprophyticus]
MEGLTGIIENADKIVEVYKDDLYSHLENNSNIIYNSLKKSLEVLCLEEKVVTSNSVYKELFPFSIIYRVKKPESLREKVIRKSLHNEVYDLKAENISENIRNKMDDLIGLTILLDTNKNLDVFAQFIFDGKISGFTAISEKKESKSSYGDLPYYNIKAKYEKNGTSALVEIQIKSTIVSAFTNIQHKLIYKNRDVSIMKNNNDEMIKAITPTVNAIEKVIDSVEESFVNSGQEIEKYQRQKRIQELIYNQSEKSKVFDVFIKDIDEIINRSIQGYVIKNSNSDLNEEEIEELFWREFTEENNQNTINVKNEEFILKILGSIGNISTVFVENIVYYDYINRYIPKLKGESNIDSDIINEIKTFIELLEFLGSKETNIYQKLLLDKSEETVEIIMNTNSVVSGFLENECETELESDTVNGINKAALLFIFDISDNIESQEMKELHLNIHALEEELNSLRGEF